jgi:predicted metal-dependent hydrolase
MVPDKLALPDQVWQGIELINQQEYFAAHEVLELAWRAERGPIRQLYQGLLQAGVGYYHLYRKNLSGALKSFSHTQRNLSSWNHNAAIPIDISNILIQVDQAKNWIQNGEKGSIHPLVIRFDRQIGE